ncbi:uncharacterized protein LOC135213279 [Macrobrachium nipponense]|uniref:uncharacterized protein LOC135213279 n=1 Tax=Macrobrachium nipponense TaxID=159736 RepID=UPI0030C80416
MYNIGRNMSRSTRYFDRVARNHSDRKKPKTKMTTRVDEKEREKIYKCQDLKTEIPKTTVFRLKEQLVREGKMPASCITRIFRSKRPSEGSLQQAVVACKEGLSLAQASEKLQVAKTTVWRRLQRLKDQDSTASATGEAKGYKVKKDIKIEVPDQSDLDYDNYCCYGLTETLAKKNQISKRKSVDVTTLESDAINSSDSQTVVLESEGSFLANEGSVIRTRSPLAIKEESLNEEDTATVVTSENSGNAHFQLEMPLVNFTGGGYQVVGSEIVIGGQHMVVLDSTGSSQHSHSNADGHIVVTPFTEMGTVLGISSDLQKKSTQDLLTQSSRRPRDLAPLASRMVSPLQMRPFCGSMQRFFSRSRASGRFVSWAIKKSSTRSGRRKGARTLDSKLTENVWCPMHQGAGGPTLDVSILKVFVQKTKFCMEINQTIQRGWMTSLDVQDAYFHVPIHPAQTQENT